MQDTKKSPSKAPNLSIIFPCYNESKTLEGIVKKVQELNWGFEPEIIIVDDKSQDNSLKIAQKLSKNNNNITTLTNERNLGKTQTVLKGIKASQGIYVTIQDADYEYNPKDLLKMYQLALKDKLDVVYGNRFGKKNKVIYWHNYFGNFLLSFISNIFTFPRIHVYLPDMEVCYKMIRGSIIRKIALQVESKTSFGFEPEITARLSRYTVAGKHLDFGVMPISYNPRRLSEGKNLHALRDGSAALIEIIRFNIFP